VIPRVARSGQSFQGAGAYYLHDKRLSDRANDAFSGIGDYALHDKQDRQTAHRVGFTAILNMDAQTPDQAIRQMSASYERYREREANKRGRKLTKPVYAYSLSWAPDQNPDRDEMMAAALSSIKALQLEGLQTLIVQHTDEPQPHIHVIINRIELNGVRARKISFDQIWFSRWAEQYERENGGIRCQQRVSNNELRRQGVFVKDTVSLTPAEYKAHEQAQREHLVDWRKEKERFLAETHTRQTGALGQKHIDERSKLEANWLRRNQEDRLKTKERFRPEWGRLYQRQRIREAELAQANRIGIFERAVFLFRHKEFLKTAGPLRMRDVVRLCVSSKALIRRVARAHEKERADLSKWGATLTQGAVGIAWREYRQDLQIMRQRQELERDGLNYVHDAEKQNLGRDLGKEAEQAPIAPPTPEKERPRPPSLDNGVQIAPSEVRALFQDREPLSKQFTKASSPSSGESYADELIKRMREYKRRNPGMDFDRER
jgi:hypothetical protein